MGEEKKSIFEIFYQIIKPDKVKILIIMLLFMLLAFLPLYPVDTSINTYENLGDMFEPDYLFLETDTLTTYDSVILVIYRDFEWTTQDYGNTNIYSDDSMILEISEYDADPSYLLTWYFPLITIVYFLACLTGELYVWSDRDKDAYERDVHLWKPPKES